MSPAIHAELGKTAEYEAWKKALPEKNQKALNEHKRQRYMLAYSKNRTFGSKQFENTTSLASQLPFIQRMLNNSEVQKNGHAGEPKGGIMNYLVIWRTLQPAQALDLYNHMKIDGSPQFLAMLERDKGIQAANIDKKELSLSHFAKMAKILKKHPLENPKLAIYPFLDAALAYSDFKDLKPTLTLFPEEVVKAMDKNEKKRYDDYMKSAREAK